MFLPFWTAWYHFAVSERERRRRRYLRKLRENVKELTQHRAGTPQGVPASDP
jgi:hypothetical protein